MCGRYKQISPFGTLAEVFGIADMPGFEASGIVAPGMKAPVIADGRLIYMTWGFVPHWSKEDLKTKIINARIETLEEKPSFRKAKRCAIPANGFFEWDKSFKPSKPFDFHLANETPFAFAGLWDEWADPKTGEVRETFAIVTKAAEAPVAGIHDRMPVILTSARGRAAWNNMEKFTSESLVLLATPAAFARQDEAQKTAQLALF